MVVKNTLRVPVEFGKGEGFSKLRPSVWGRFRMIRWQRESDKTRGQTWMRSLIFKVTGYRLAILLMNVWVGLFCDTFENQLINEPRPLESD